MDNDIEKIYKKFNYPSSVPKLLKLAKAAGIIAKNEGYTGIFKQTGGSAADQDYKTKKTR